VSGKRNKEAETLLSKENIGDGKTKEKTLR
jgi:hypothetical protein